MPLPIQADLADIEAICGYLIAKPAGATSAELINRQALDRRKLSALKFWGLIEDAGTKLRLSERGLMVARDNGANKVAALREVVASITPYASVIARAVENKDIIIAAADVAAHWHRHFRAYTQFGILNYQIVCFFRVAEGAELGRLVVGRKGSRRGSNWPKTTRGNSSRTPTSRLRRGPKASMVHAPRRPHPEIMAARDRELTAEATASSSPTG